MSLHYHSHVTGGLLYVRPDALKLFAGSRCLVIPDWLLEVSRGTPKSRAGAPEKYDWSAIESQLYEECRLQGGIPREDHSDMEWRRQARAMKYLRDYFILAEGGPSDTTLKLKLREMFPRIAAKLAAVGN